jgi:hypothetical protein
MPNFVFQDFVDVHQEANEKFIVIDSAEGLLNLKNNELFKEFLSVLTKNNWKIIFTTRDDYLENLNSDFFEIYNIKPLSRTIKNLTLVELQKLAEKNSFLLPEDEKILDLIRTLFYLNRYLSFYQPNEKLNIIEFKNKLWHQTIKTPASEQFFLQIAFKRANEGQFFVQPYCDSQILDNELRKDEVLGYETAGYFITHDIYEEWALEKIIESVFINKSHNEDFFNQIGTSLPIRRSFRKWLSEKLSLELEK